MIEFIVKFSIPFLIICASLFNLFFKTGNDHLWIVLLCSCLSYLVPSPEIKNLIKTLTTNNSIPK